MKRIIATTVVALIGVLALPARAETPEMTQDLKCLTLSFTLLQSADSAVVEAAKVAAFYYLGRVDGRDRSLDLAERLNRPDMRMSAEALRQLAPVCGDQLSQRGRELQAVATEIDRAEP
jgi:hypothetical protein